MSQQNYIIIFKFTRPSITTNFVPETVAEGELSSATKFASFLEENNGSWTNDVSVDALTLTFTATFGSRTDAENFFNSCQSIQQEYLDEKLSFAEFKVDVSKNYS